MTLTRLSLYDRVADEISGRVIRRYSTSFGLASRLLEPRVRQHVENIYALVRVADEIVDGGVAEAGLDQAAAGRRPRRLPGSGARAWAGRRARWPRRRYRG